jgi:NAD(P)H dehydrogenase (quinone)
MNFYVEALAHEMVSAVGQRGSQELTGVTENRVAFASRDDIAAAAAGILVGGAMRAPTAMPQLAR